MNEQQQRMAAVGTDKELNDLLDFSAVVSAQDNSILHSWHAKMFAPPVANGKNRTMTLASSQFGGSAIDERSGSGSWGSAEQNSPSFSQGRVYGEGPHYNEHEGLSSPFISAGVAGKNERPPYPPFGSQPGFHPNEIAMPSPDAMSPSGLKSGSQFYPSYPNNPRRRPPDAETQPKKIRKPPGLPSSVRAYFCSPSQLTVLSLSLSLSLSSFLLSFFTTHFIDTQTHTLHSPLCLSSAVTDGGKDPLLSQSLSELTRQLRPQ
ncbi:transcription factor E2-alpha-like isoform X2 [Notothenia coriiceps]|uniref:Transcription factor E2-alpha-like isoform X2 n=1 Tax=Notothenia coriiceps TaxID=8208 RepID=A0A6I9PRI2_9TELE|nr:PREDICTED: transcription factor E2-alpha-like isoform X2 [Notothenia coriiceps]